MPVALEDRIRVGVLGLEATHEHDATGLVLNAPRELGYPRYRVQKIPGLHSLPEGEDVRDQRYGQLGEKARPSLPRGKTVTYEGEVQARTLAELREACNDLRYAFGDRRFEQRINVNPHPDNPLGMPMFYRARCTALEIDEEQTFRETRVPSPWCRPFVLTFRMGDPRFYEVELNTVTGNVADQMASVSVTNLGTAPADPVIYVAGETGNDWTVTGHHDHTLRFVGWPIPSSDSAIIDFAERRLTLGGNNWSGRTNADSDWWDDGVEGLPPRSTHDITLRNDISDGHLTVEWRNAFY